MNVKKLISLTLAVLMLVSIAAIAPVSAAEKATTFKFTDNQGWGSVYVYCWDESGKGIGGEWPGVAGRDAEVNGYGETFFTIDVPAGAVGCVVNNGKGAQTSDITDFTAEGYYTDGTKNDKGHFIAIPWPGEGGSEEPTATTAEGTDWYLWGSYVVDEETSTDFGNGDEWNKATPYNFNSKGTLTATFDTDTYIGVKNLKTNSWYMTDGWVGKVESATLYNADTYKFSGPADDPDTKNKLFIPGGVQVTITMSYNSTEDSITLAYTTNGGSVTPTTPSATKTDWYLWGSYVVDEETSTDFGNGDEWDKATPYNFNSKGTLTTTFETDTYIGVKNLKTNSWYMTDGWVGKVESAALYNADTYKFSGPEDDPDTKNKFFIPGGVQVTITMSYNSTEDSITLSYTTGGSVDPSEITEQGSDWYLWGSYVVSEDNYTDFGNGDEWNKTTPYNFNSNGTLTTTFDTDTYVGVKNLKTNRWYMTDGWAGEVQSATLYNTDTYTFSSDDPLTAKDKLHIPAGVEVTITMVYNSAEDNIVLSYAINEQPTEPEETTVETEPETEPETVTEEPTEVTTAAPTTEAATTEPATTEAPTTEVPTTEPVTTAAPTTAAPTTEPATTEEPTTAAPTTEAPTTAPVTTQPATEKQKVDISGWDVVGLSDAVYTGSEITRKIVVTNGANVATVSTIYTNNKNAGVATVVIQGNGDYTGTIVKTFKIAKASQNFTAKAKTKSVKIKKLKKAKATVKNIFTIKKNKGAVTYKKSSGSKYLKISSKGVITVKKGKYKKKTLTIKVKVTAKGNANFKSASKTIKVKVKLK